MNPAFSNNDINYLFNKYAKQLHLYALTFLHTREDSEDVVQDIFMHFWEKHNNYFTEEKAVKSYLFNSVRNACLDRLEKKNVVQHNIDIIKQDIFFEETIQYDEKVFQDVQKELSLLPTQTQRIIVCIFSKSMKYQEVADELHISINTVKTLLRKGIQQLRLRFANYPELLFCLFRKK
ncbi:MULTISPECIES: RNA polymerase sigma factor [Butyricimonas]|uniref:RNA polymerase sigma factor n=1 Tax=Butyricimonas TaxID=574697 RepID=UPI0007FB2636|nr:MULTISPECIES: sigma-70 family RNA polymerase sigma factor [Butyricimonas]